MLWLSKWWSSLVGKSKAVTVGYKYYAGEHLVLCHGPIDKITKVEVDERVAWTGAATGGSITISAENLFGGESREGGISGTVDIEMGEPTQGQNDYLVARLGSEVPGYRGVVSAVLRQCYLGNNPYLKPWAFWGQRIHKAQDGDTQWYDAKAEIGSILLASISENWDYQFATNALPAPSSVPSGGWTSGGVAPFGVAPSFTPPFPIQTNWPKDTAIWIRNTVSCPGGLDIQITGQVENAAWVFWDGVLVGSVNPDNTDTPVVLTIDFTIPAGSAPSGNHELAIFCLDDFTVYGSGDNTYIYAEASVAEEHADMNPAHIIRECLTNQDWGMGYQDADIDEDSFRVAADKLFAERLGISLLWDRQIVLEAFVGEIVKHIDASLYVSRTTGKFVLKLVRGDYDADTLLELDESNIVKVANPNTPTFGELTNSVTVNYWDATTGKDASLSLQDPALVQMQGAVIGTTLQYPGFTNVRNAGIVAQRDLRSLSFPLFSCTLYVNRDAKDLNVGDVFKLSWAKWQIAGMVMRVTGLAFGDGKSNQVRVTCVQDIFTTPTVIIQGSDGGEWVDPDQEPTPATNRIAFEVPYYELTQILGQADIDASLGTNADLGYVMAAAAQPSSGYNARLWTNSGAGYEEVGALDFAPSCTLVSDIVQMDTVIDVENISNFDLITVGSFCQIGSGNEDMELCRVDAVDEVGGTVTLGRGALDTTPKLHAAGTRIYFWDLYSGYDPTEYVASDEVDVKITPASGSGVVELIDAPEDTVTLDSRAIRPYPPGKLQFDTEDYPALVPSDSTDVTWAHRDRTQETGGTIYDHTFGNIGPEVGTEYEIDVRDDGDPTIRQSYTGIAGTSQTVDLSALLTEMADVEVWSVRDGYRSLQPARHVFEFTTDTLFLVFPLTYDETSQDETGATTPTWTRQGDGPHVTPDGFEGDGNKARYKTTSVPAWMATAVKRTIVHGSIKFYPYDPMSGSNGDTIIHIGADAAGAVPNPKLRLSIQRDTTLDWGERAYLALQTYDSALRTIPLARPWWKYQREFPVLVGTGGFRQRPQGLMFRDASNLLVSAHREDLETLVYNIDLTTMDVTGSFSFGTSTYRHNASIAKNAAGDVWFADYETDKILKVDVPASLTAGTASITTVWDTSVLAGVSGLAFITVSGTEYVLIGEYGTSGTKYLYVYAASGMSGTATVAGRFKRFVLGTYVQGIAVKNNHLYVTRSISGGVVDRYDNIDTIISGTADGATLTRTSRRPHLCDATEDLDFHPSTGDCWSMGEGWEAVDDFDGFCGIWSSPLDGSLQENHVTAYYDGNGKVGAYLNNRFHSEKSYTPTPAVDCISIGGPPQATGDFGGSFFNGFLRNVRFQNKPFEGTEYADTVGGTTYEPNTLTTYTVTLTNPGAESGTTGWTNETGSIGTRSATPAPKSGSNYFTGGAVAQAIARQRFSIATVTGLSTTDIDTAAAAGGLWAKVRWWQTSFDTNDPAGAGIRTLDGVPTQIAISYSTIDWTAYSDSGVTATWYPLAHSKAIESGARNVDVIQRHDRTSGTNSDGYQDDFSFVIYKQ